MRTYFEIKGHGNIMVQAVQDYKKQSKDFYKRDQPLSVQVGVFVAIPFGTKSNAREDMLSGKIRPTFEDTSEVIKPLYEICAALQGIAYENKAQIIGAIIYKYYAAKPCIKVTIDSIREEKKSGTD